MIPVVLSGGSGTRLWPLSRTALPKQFVDLFDESLLLKTLRRVAPLADGSARGPWALAVAEHRPQVERALTDLGFSKSHGLYEPRGRNTAPATALLCHVLAQRGHGDDVVGLFPADHLVSDEDELRAACRLAEQAARDGQVATIGIRPTLPATGYGYLELGEVALSAETHRAHRVLSFREKPDRATAEGFLAQGNFVWNAGMFVFHVATMSRHFERLMPELWQQITRITPDLANLAAVYGSVTPESLDYGIMEKLEAQVSIPCDPGWSDVGSWDEVARLATPSGAIFEHNSRDNFIRGAQGKVYGLVGVEDLIVVDTADALLVARRGSSQDVKALVDQLRGAGRREVDEHRYEKRPWGGFEILRDETHFKSKVLRVDPGHQLSYQSHEHRAEHWVVVRGNPEVVLDGAVLSPGPGECVYIPRGARHRIRNPTAETVELVEVQTGTYFGEDDIIRYEDDYERN